MTVTTTPARARTDRAGLRRGGSAGSAATVRSPGSPSGGSRPLAALTLGAPVLLAGGIALHPDDTHGVAQTLGSIAGDQGVVWSLVHLAEPSAWILLGVTLLFALPRMASDRGRRLLSVAGVFAAIGFTAIALLVYAHGEAFRFMAMSGVAPESYAALFDQFENGFPLAALPSMLGRIGLLLAVVGLFRARTIPRWAACLLVVPALALGSTSGLPLPLGLLIVFGPLVTVLAFCARRTATTGGPALHPGS